jgi:hypothetical protein
MQKSLTLLKVNALNADFNVVVLVVQKLIRQKEVKPISSQPKKSIIVLPDKTKNIILITNDSMNRRNLSTSGSCRKYENA